MRLSKKIESSQKKVHGSHEFFSQIHRKQSENSQNFRLRRAKNTVSVSISDQKGLFSFKIAPEGRENFRVKKIEFAKSKKHWFHVLVKNCHARGRER